MERLKNIRTLIPFTVSLLFILLFVYAAVSKLVDYENFRVQLGQSPLLTAYAHIVAWAVPAIELIIAVGLVSPKLRLRGLYASFALMVMFTAYIVIILNFTEFIPCSCGGVLEDLGWTEHLIFNLVFIVLAALSIVLSKSKGTTNSASFRGHKSQKYVIINTLKQFGLMTLSAICIVMFFFLTSANPHQTRGDFVRQFSDTAIKLDKILDLSFNSYYFSGVDSNYIYLGNVTAPLRLTLITKDLGHKEEILLSLDHMDYPFRSLKTVIEPPYFYLYDGTVPCLFRGNIGEWSARLQFEPPITFSKLTSLGEGRFAIRTILGNPRRHNLGVLEYYKDSVIHSQFEEGLQSDGYAIFDGDGTFTYNAALNQAVYTLYYRNQYMHFPIDVDTLIIGKTIDSINHAQIEVTILKNGRAKMNKPPRFVNQITASLGNFLLVQSKVMDRIEPKFMWDIASVVDVYDLLDHKYRFSFYINKINEDYVRELLVHNNKMYTLANQYLGSYSIDMELFDY